MDNRTRTTALLPRLAALVTAVAVALIGSSALAATPTQTQYGNPAKNEPTKPLTPPKTGTKGGVQTSPTPAVSGGEQPTTTSSGGELPFTGFQVIALLGIGGALVGTGLVLRRVGRSRDK